MQNLIEKIKSPPIALGLIAGLAFLTYARFLGTGLTGRDLPELLWTAHGLSVQEIFARGLLTSGTFYRPLATLSYAWSLDWFGLNAFGYHLTDVLLHAAVAVLTYVFVRISWSRKGGYAVLAGLIVAVHPAAVEVVPNISHRMDSLVTVWTLLTLVLVAVAREKSAREGFAILLDPAYLAALVCFGAAVLSKEIGFVTPLIVAAYVGLVPRGTDRGRRGGNLPALVLPLLVLAVGVMWWRAQVLGSALGGVEQSPFADLAGWTKQRASDGVTYVWFLLFPGAQTPADYDTNQAGNFVAANWGRLALVLALAAAGLGAAWRVSRERTGEAGTRLLRYVIFLAVWTGLPFGVYALTLFRFRYIYFSIPPAAILLAVLTLSCYRALRGRGDDTAPVSGPARFARGWRVVGGIGLAAALVVGAQLVYFSPLAQKYAGFEASGRLVTALLADYSQQASALATADPITVENLPYPQWRLRGAAPESRELGNLWLPAYYRLVSGKATGNWCVKSMVQTGEYDAPFETGASADHGYLIRFQVERAGEKTEYAGCCEEFFCK